MYYLQVPERRGAGLTGPAGSGELSETYTCNQWVGSKRESCRGNLWAKAFTGVQGLTQAGFLREVLIGGWALWILRLRGGHCSISVCSMQVVGGGISGASQVGCIQLSLREAVTSKWLSTTLSYWEEAESEKLCQGWLSPTSGMRKSSLDSRPMPEQHKTIELTTCFMQLGFQCFHLWRTSFELSDLSGPYQLPNWIILLFFSAALIKH